MAMLYAQKSAHSKLTTLGHFFKGTSTLDELLGVAGASYELVASIPQVCKYLSRIPWSTIAAYEESLQKILLDYLRSDPERFQIYGEPTADAAKRVPVISFTVQGWKSKTIVETLEKTSPFGFRFGAFYSNRLVKEVLGLDPADGVVRVSLVHYNTGMCLFVRCRGGAKVGNRARGPSLCKGARRLAEERWVNVGGAVCNMIHRSRPWNTGIFCFM